MVQEYIINYLLLFILLEYFELSWQKAPTLMGMFVRMHHYYAKSVWIFLLMHPTFYFAIAFAMLTDYNGAALLLLFMKTIDIATKLILIQQIFDKKQLTQELAVMLLAPLNQFLPYIGLLLYSFLVYIALA